MRRRPGRLPALLLLVAIVATGCQIPAAWLALLGGPEVARPHRRRRPPKRPARRSCSSGRPSTIRTWFSHCRSSGRLSRSTPIAVCSSGCSNAPPRIGRSTPTTSRSSIPVPRGCSHRAHPASRRGRERWSSRSIRATRHSTRRWHALTSSRRTISPATSREQDHVTFGFGEGERIETIHPVRSDAPAGSVPARSIDYVILLDDGRTLVIQASGPEAAEGFATLIDNSVSTLAMR